MSGPGREIVLRRWPWPIRVPWGKVVRVVRWGGLTLAALVGLAVVLTLIFRWVPPPTTAFMLRDRTPAPDGGPRYEWVPRKRISPWVGLAFVAAEDQKFPDHRGFDFEAISEALSEDRQRTRGASTISQQVAKNLFLWPGRSLLRKGLEAGATLLIEVLWPKRRILEVYVNVAEVGPGVFGVGAASRAYFGRPPESLGLGEAARMAAVLPNPKRFSVSRPSPYVLRRAAWIEGQARQLGGPSFLAGIGWE